MKDMAMNRDEDITEHDDLHSSLAAYELLSSGLIGCCIESL